MAALPRPSPRTVCVNLALWSRGDAVDPRLEANRRNWNERTPIHAVSAFYDVASFKAGRITLHDIERREVGDVAGKSLLHMQCHFGLDTMSWTRLGAQATGVDFSNEAIALARSLSSELGLSTRFVEANVYDLPDLLRDQFDIVYTAMGVLCWLPDLDAWAKVAARFVKPGGFFYLFDGHPLLSVFTFAAGPGQPSVADLRVTYPYFHDREGMSFEGGDPSYTGGKPLASPTHEWAHSLAEIMAAVQNAGLTLEFLHEFPVNCYQAFPGMEKGEDGWWRYPKGQRQLPQTFSLRARKAA